MEAGASPDLSGHCAAGATQRGQRTENIIHKAIVYYYFIIVADHPHSSKLYSLFMLVFTQAVSYRTRLIADTLNNDLNLLIISSKYLMIIYRVAHHHTFL